VAVSAVASKSAKTAIERQSKEVSLARTNDFLGIYGGLVSMCLGMSGKRRERIASRMEQAPRRLALGDGLARESPMSHSARPWVRRFQPRRRASGNGSFQRPWVRGIRIQVPQPYTTPI
jgi:hypothetical protein